LSCTPQNVFEAFVEKLRVATVKPLFQTRSAGTGYECDVSPDGQRFLVNILPEQIVSAPITVVLDWTAGLKK